MRAPGLLARDAAPAAAGCQGAGVRQGRAAGRGSCPWARGIRDGRAGCAKARAWASAGH